MDAVSHLRTADGTVLCDHVEEHEDLADSPLSREVEAAADHPYDHDEHLDHHEEGHDHSHGLVDRSILRSRAGVKAVALSLLILGVTAGVQVVIFTFSNSVALLADLIHNFGDALTATGW